MWAEEFEWAIEEWDGVVEARVGGVDGTAWKIDWGELDYS